MKRQLIMDLIEVDFCKDEYSRFVRLDIYETEDGEELAKITILEEPTSLED